MIATTHYDMRTGWRSSIASRHGIAVALAAVGLSFALLAGCGQNPATAGSKSQEEAQQTSTTDDATSSFTNLASFTARTADGATFTQDDFAKADVTLVNLWSTTCGPCIDELPALAAWAKALPSNVRAITVCLDYGSDPQYAQQLLKEAGFENVTLVSGDGDFQTLWNQVQYTPTTIVVDAKGTVLGELIGAPYDVAKGYTELVNQALMAQGKEAIGSAA